MRNLFIIYSVVFLLAGNVLSSSIHYLFDHTHNNNEEIHECQECIIIEHNNNYVSYSQEINFSKNTNISFYEYFSLITLNIDRKYSSRAPPIS